MEKLEKNIWIIWKKIRNNQFVKINEIEKLDVELGKTFAKIQRQRERLEKSRDMWKDKYKRLKEKNEFAK